MRERRGGTPDLIVLADSVLTMGPVLPVVEGVAVRDGRIVAVGSRWDLLGLAGHDTEVVERAGGCVVPGFHDSHIHLLACANRRLQVDCSPAEAGSIAQIQQKIRAKAASVPQGAWIRAGNYDEFRLVERRHPTRRELDAAAPDHPVRLLHRSLHACVLNSAALRAAGLWPLQTSNGRVETDPATGEPTGLVYEGAAHLGRGAVPPLEEAELRDSLRQALADLVARGVTSVQDASAGNGMAEWERVREVCSEAGVRPRIGLMVGMGHLDRFVEAGMGPGFGDEWLRIGAAKVMLTENGGDFHPSVQELAEQVGRANRLGFQVAIHAVEESAICVAAETLAGAAPEVGRPRHRIEHCSVLPPPLLDRLAEAGIAVATQPGFLYDSGDRYLAEVEDHRQGWLYPLRSLVEKGIQVGGGSDAPVASFDPREGIYAAVTRLSREGRAVGTPERISIHDALRMYTLGSARICGEGRRTGSIEPGKLADLVVLSADPRTVEPAELLDVHVEMAIIGGRIAWERGGRLV